MNVSPKLLLGQLVKNKQITEAEANQYEVASLQKDVSIIDYLYKYTNLQRIEIVKAQAEIEKITYVDLEKTPIDSEAVGLVSESISRRYKIIPYLFDSINATISIATEDPFDRSIIDFLEKKTGKKMTLWPGYCPTHVKILPEDIIQRKKEYPRAKVVVHPECRPDVIALADEALSTSGIIRYAAREDVRELIVGTEREILHRLNKENPGKKFIHASPKAVCPNMKRINLEKILWVLEEMSNQVTVPEETSAKARKAIQRMLEASA